MTLGLGIFLSVLVLVPVIIFCVTRKTWNWARTLKRSLIFGGSAAAAIAVIIYGYLLWAGRLQKETQLLGVSLGDTATDVIFKKGKSELHAPGKIWSYLESEDVSYYVGFSDSSVDRIFLESVRFKKPTAVAFRDTGIGSSLEEINRVYGEPSLIHQSQDSMTWLVSFRRYNIGYLLFRNRCYGLLVFDGTKTNGIELTDDIITARAELIRMEEARQAADKARKSAEEKQRQAEEALSQRQRAAEEAARKAAQYESERIAAVDRYNQERSAKLKGQAALDRDLRRTSDRYRSEVEKWNSLQVGMTAKQVEAILGSPATTFDYLTEFVWYYAPLPGSHKTPSVKISRSGGLKQVDGPDPVR